MGRAVLVVGFSVVLACALLASGASASCVPSGAYPKEIAAAPAAFVGTVTSVENSDRWAVVEVTEVWKGTVDDRVEIRGGPKDPPGKISVATSVDRAYEMGETYLFVPYKGSGALFRDNACTRTTAYRPALDRFRPASAEIRTSPPPPETPTSATPRQEDDGISTWVFVAVGLGAVGSALVVARRLRAGGGPPSDD